MRPRGNSRLRGGGLYKAASAISSQMKRLKAAYMQYAENGRRGNGDAVGHSHHHIFETVAKRRHPSPKAHGGLAAGSIIIIARAAAKRLPYGVYVIYWRNFFRRAIERHHAQKIALFYLYLPAALRGSIDGPHHRKENASPIKLASAFDNGRRERALKRRVARKLVKKPLLKKARDAQYFRSAFIKCRLSWQLEKKIELSVTGQKAARQYRRH